MLLLSWNVNFRRPGDQIAEIKAKGPDIVILQEVKVRFAKDWAKRLSDIGFGHHYLSGEDVWSGKDAQAASYQCLIASHWTVTPDDIGWRRCAPYPELLGRTTVSVPGEGEFEVFTAHIPNGDGNGWKKIDTFHVLAAELRRANDSPRILTGDFNEPKRFEDSGQIVTFEECEVGCWRDQFGDERPRIEWINGVLSVLDGESQHGLRDAYRNPLGSKTRNPVTFHKPPANPRCFDHTFVSPHFEVLGCDYYHEWRQPLKLSDHSPMWARLRLRTDQPDWKQWTASALQTMLVRILNWSACMRLYRRFARFLTRAFVRLRE